MKYILFVLSLLLATPATADYRLSVETYGHVAHTVVGDITVEEGGEQQVLTWKNTLLAKEDFVMLLGRIDFEHYEILIVGSQCAGTGCGFIEFRFLRIQSGTKPQWLLQVRPDDIPTSSDEGYVTLKTYPGFFVLSNMQGHSWKVDHSRVIHIGN